MISNSKEMMYTNDANRTCLCTLVAHLLDEANSRAHARSVERIVKNVSAVPILLCDEFRHSVMILHFMRLDRASCLADPILDLALQPP